MLFLSKYKLYYLIPIAFLGILFLAFSPKNIEKAAQETYSSPKFDEYWNQGKAEINSYDLQQARYGSIHQGYALLIFVTEHFSKSKQVKLNTIYRNEEDAVQVLKTNFSKRFVTGIYDYSIFQSIFTPIDIVNYNNTLKVTTSIQDWCGHTFSQLNLQSYKYKIMSRSYFETEGDREYQIEQALLEDEIWNLIRITPKELPTGEIQVIPSLTTAQLRHTTVDLEDASATLEAHQDEKGWMTYTVDFTTSRRTLAIHFHKKFPHQIEGWEETYIDNGKELTTKATRKKTMLSDYWNKTQLQDIKLRKELGLP